LIETINFGIVNLTNLNQKKYRQEKLLQRQINILKQSLRSKDKAKNVRPTRKQVYMETNKGRMLREQVFLLKQDYANVLTIFRAFTYKDEALFILILFRDDSDLVSSVNSFQTKVK
jgi:hypothetical protein